MARVDYDRMAPDYLEGRALPPAGMAPWRAAMAPWMAAVRNSPGPVLDLGAGTGQFAAAIAGWFGVEVVAVEPSGGMREQARAHPHPGVWWVAGRAERLPLGDGACAWAWVSTVVHHLDDLDAAAAELGRVLRPGGPVLVRQAFPGRMEEITLYQRFFPGAPRAGRPRPRPPRSRWSTASTCWSCAVPARPGPWPSAPGRGRRRPGPG